MHLVAIDPGTRKAGYALFAGPVLVEAHTIITGISPTLPASERCALIGGQIAHAVHPYLQEKSELVFEWPQLYAPGQSKGDPNKMALLMAVCASTALLFLDAPVAFTDYLPAQWTRGTPPKPKRAESLPWQKSKRAVRIRSRLSEVEIANAWSADIGPDAIDAIGIGLHHLGRLKPKRVLPGAT